MTRLLGLIASPQGLAGVVSIVLAIYYMRNQQNKGNEGKGATGEGGAAGGYGGGGRGRLRRADLEGSLPHRRRPEPRVCRLPSHHACESPTPRTAWQSVAVAVRTITVGCAVLLKQS